MTRILASVSLSVLCLAISCQADATIWYAENVWAGKAIPIAVAAGMNATQGPWAGVSVRIKGTKSASWLGEYFGIFDSATGELTLTHSSAHVYTKTTPAAYTAAPKNPGTAPVPGRFIFESRSAKTGRTETIIGIPTEEYLTTLTMMLNTPTGSSAPIVRMTMNSWIAEPAEVAKVSVLREYFAVKNATRGLTHQPDLIEKMLGVSEFSQKMDEAIAGMEATGGLVVRNSSQIYSSSLVSTLASRAKSPGANFDPGAPFIESDMRLSSISDKALPDLMFEASAAMSSVGLTDFLNAAAAAAPSAVARDGVTNPVPISSPPAQYTNEARHAKIEGDVRLSIVVSPQGKAEDIRVVKTLGFGLEEKAIEAVKRWKFIPGMKDGVPVTVRVQIAVSFRLL